VAVFPAVKPHKPAASVQGAKAAKTK